MENIFDSAEAINRLEKNRNQYVGKLFEYMQQAVKKNKYDLAAEYIIAAADNLKGVNGALDYLQALSHIREAGDTENYPEFETIL